MEDQPSSKMLLSRCNITETRLGLELVAPKHQQRPLQTVGTQQIHTNGNPMIIRLMERCWQMSKPEVCVLGARCWRVDASVNLHSNNVRDFQPAWL